MVHGFLNIRKQKWKSSYDVIRDLKYITEIKKFGHTGTLDPLAEGVLVVAVNEATKMIEFMEDDYKEYSAEIILGKQSDTFDATGEISNFSDRQPERSLVAKTLKKFIGTTDQVPPKFSAVKVKGKRAYELARKGKEFELKSKKVHIKSINIIKYDYPVLRIDVVCGSGTYIRSLADDIGAELNTGAYLNTLLRTRVGEFLLKDSIEVLDVSKKGIGECIIHLNNVSYGMPEITINEDELKELNYGRTISRDDINADNKYFAAYFDKRLAGVLEIVEKKPEITLKYKKKLNVIKEL
jgi:tRNA pseudouridine55 synthase